MFDSKRAPTAWPRANEVLCASVRSQVLVKLVLGYKCLRAVRTRERLVPRVTVHVPYEFVGSGKAALVTAGPLAHESSSTTYMACSDMVVE